MVSLKSPPMVILCVVLFKFFIFRFFEQEDAARGGREGLTRYFFRWFFTFGDFLTANGRKVTSGLTETLIYRVNPFTLQRVCRVVEQEVRDSETLLPVVHEQRGGNEEST